jgi:hypothetical protein
VDFSSVVEESCCHRIAGMSNKRNSRSMKRSMRQNVVRIPFSHAESGVVTLASGFQLSTFNVAPTLLNRLVDIADDFLFYRFTELTVELLTPGPAGTATAECVVQVLGFLPETTDTPPASATQVGDLLHSVFSGYTNQVGSESAPMPMRGTPARLTLGRSDLVSANANKWWKTKVSSNLETWEEIQGSLYLGTDSSANSASVVGYALMFKGVCEFSSPCNATQTPWAIRDREKEEACDHCACPGSGKMAQEPTPGVASKPPGPRRNR